MNILTSLGLLVFAYLCGSLPFSIWLTRWKTGTDVRTAGSGHATATNTMRQAGWAVGVLALVLDIAKGFLPVYLALRLQSSVWIVMLVAMMAVVGHCWPAFAGFKGGMGLATASGTMLAISPLAWLIGLGILIILILLIRHAARAVVIAAVVIPSVYWLVGFREEIIWTAIGLAVVIGLRFLIDWKRQYRELWLDRESDAKKPS
jgi:glycerol-3-phosphate acyltransferase PlsY